MGKFISDEELAVRAAKYDNLQEFRKNDPNAERRIRERGLQSKLCRHMKYGHRSPLSEDELVAIISNYSSLKELRTKDPNTYNVLQKRGLIKKLCGHLKRAFRDDLSDDKLAEIASRYDVLQEFREADPIAYQLIHKRGLTSKLLKHMKRGHREDLSDDDLAIIASRYDSLKEFQMKEHVTYAIIHKRGLFDKLCGHMKRETEYMTNEELESAASKYNILKEFREKEPSVYRRIRDRGLLDKLCGDMERDRSQSLSNEDLAEKASRYDTLKEFRKKENSAYSLICKRGLFDKLCGHMKRSCRDLTDELLATIAIGYSTRDEFCEKDSSAYSTACKRGIIDKICSHMERQIMPVGYWTKERCRQKAKDYNSKTDFRKGCPSAHGAAQKNGWLDDICSHMIPKGNWFKRKIYVFTFSDGYAYVGLAQDPADRYRAHVTGYGNTPIYPHIKETGASYEFKILTDWLDKDVAGNVEEEYRKKYAADGWKMLNRMKGGGLGGTTSIYTPQRLKKEVEKYEYVDDLRKGSPSFYRYILHHHLWDEYCGMMKFRRAPNKYWTLDRAINVAQEVEYRSELRVRCHQAYHLLNKAGLLDVYFPKRKKQPKREKIWTVKKSLTVVPLYNSRYQLQKERPGAYTTLRDAGLLDKYFPTKWVRPFTDEERAEIITSCKTRSELHHKHKSIYDSLRKEGLLDKYFPK